MLGLVVAELLFETFPDAAKASLRAASTRLVRGETCAEVAARTRSRPPMSRWATARQAGGRRKATILADACEALLGAVYLDGGLESRARQLSTTLLGAPRSRGRRPMPRDAKTALQEWAQAGALRRCRAT